MKKFTIIIILAYILLTLNTHTNSENLNKDKENSKILKIGVIVPLTGEFKQIGQSVLKAIQLAVLELNESKIHIYPKDNKNNVNNTYQAAKELDDLGVKIVIGPIFFENLEKLSEINNITFISLTNKTENLPKNIISFGINIKSQLEAITNYLLNKNITKTILLLPESEFTNQIQPIVQNHKFKFFKTFSYNTDPIKITKEIEKITNYKQRKINLRARIKKLEKSDLEKDKRELEKLKQLYTLGEVNFKSVVIADFGESLKSVLASFNFADVSNEDVKFFTFNQWFDESLFNEKSFQNLIFPGVDLDNFNKFNEKYFKVFGELSTEISILAYDAVALIYLTWRDNNEHFKNEKLSNKTTFKGLHGEFIIKNNISNQKLNIYKIFEKEFVKIN